MKYAHIFCQAYICKGLNAFLGKRLRCFLRTGQMALILYKFDTKSKFRSDNINQSMSAHRKDSKAAKMWFLRSKRFFSNYSFHNRLVTFVCCPIIIFFADFQYFFRQQYMNFTQYLLHYHSFTAPPPRDENATKDGHKWGEYICEIIELSSNGKAHKNK